MKIDFHNIETTYTISLVLKGKLAMSVSTTTHEAPNMLNTSITYYEEQSGEAYMNSRQKAHLKRILEVERAYWSDIQNRIISEFLQKKNGCFPSDAADIANQEIEIRSAVRGREHRLIKKIDDALKRIEIEGKQYGFCEICHAEIGIKRLEVRPTANLCFDCKTLDEIREKQTSHN